MNNGELKEELQILQEGIKAFKEKDPSYDQDFLKENIKEFLLRSLQIKKLLQQPVENKNPDHRKYYRDCIPEITEITKRLNNLFPETFIAGHTKGDICWFIYCKDPFIYMGKENQKHFKSIRERYPDIHFVICCIYKVTVEILRKKSLNQECIIIE